MEFLKLILVRHAKTEEQSATGRDFDRPLTIDGISDAERMANQLLKMNIIPDFIIHSDAERTTATAKIFAAVLLKNEEDRTADDTLYNSGTEDYFELITSISSVNKVVMVVGHNPTISELILLLTRELVSALSPCAMCQIAFPYKKWNEIQEQSGMLLFVKTPAMI